MIMIPLITVGYLKKSTGDENVSARHPQDNNYSNLFFTTIQLLTNKKKCLL